jgi:hypothetical protein
MGWTLRKSFKLGPTRINLSSRGIGYSVGVRGFRVGTRASGRGYVSAGRGMLRYQASLGSAQRTRSTGPAVQLVASTLAGSDAAMPRTGAGCVTLLIVGLMLSALFAALTSPRTALALFLPALAMLVYRGVKSSQQAKREAEHQAGVAALDEAVDALLNAPATTEQHARRVALQRQSLGTLPEGRTDTFETAYRTAVGAAVADQKVTPQEKARLGLLARGLGLSPEFIRKANLGGFLEGFYALVGDGKLTEEEDANVTALREAFGVPEEQVRAQLQKADQLRRARAVELAPTVDAVPVDVKLKKGESAYYSADCSEMRYYVEGDFRPVKLGRVYVTSERVLFVGEGTTSIKLEKVLRLNIEPRREGGEIVGLSIDGRKTPYYLFAAEPFVLAAHIKRAWEAAHNAV